MLSTPSPGELHSGATLRHGVSERADSRELEVQAGPNVSTQRTVFVDVASPLPVVPQALGPRTLSGVGAFDRPPAEPFTPEYAAPLPDLPFLAWLQEHAAAERRPEVSEPIQPAAPNPEVLEPIRVPSSAAPSSRSAIELRRPTLELELQAATRPLPLAARVQPVADKRAAQSYFTWVGSMCAMGLVGLSVWPFELSSVAHGSFQRYSQIELAASSLSAPVAALHVVAGQHVRAGAPLISLDASALEHELAELNVTLDKTLVAQVQAQATRQAELDAQAIEQRTAQAGLEQRTAKKRAELDVLEAQRDELLEAPKVSPVKLSALDDQVDERRRELWALAEERKQLSARFAAPLTAANELEQLTRAVASLRERRNALQRMLHSRQVVAAHSGTVTQVLPGMGEVVESGAPVVRILPDNPALRLAARFDAQDASALRNAKRAILSVGPDEMVLGVQVVRVSGESSAPESCCSVELRLDDAASLPELDRQLRRDAKLSVEFERERSLLALAAERLRGRH